MADIASNMTVVRWLRSQAEPLIDLSDEYIYSIMIARCMRDDALTLADVSEKQLDLALADIYYTAATSSVKTGTQGESDGGWTHYVAIKNSVNREGLMRRAQALYNKWSEPFFDMSNPIRMKPLY